MSWFTRSIANTLQQLDLNNADDDDDNVTNNTNISTHQKPPKQQQDSDHVEDNGEDSPPLSPSRGVKEDLSEITKTLSRQFWGVASFLAPPPPEHSDHQSDHQLDDPDQEGEEAIAGIRRDFAEIGGRFRSGISKLKTNIDVSEITKIATNFLQLSPDGEDYVLNKEAGEAIGVTDEVVAFVRDITMHPETWLDFPLPNYDQDVQEDFELSDAQQEHALTVESLAPRLAALRIELCPGYMSESSFWKIYFVLLHPRLEPHAAELLSTPEIVKARAALKYELKGRSSSQTEEVEGLGNNFPSSEYKADSPQEQHPPEPSGIQSESVPLVLSTTKASTSGTSVDVETEKHPIPSEVQVVDKSVIQEEPRNETQTEDQNVVEDKDDDDWLKEDDDKDNSENVTGTTTIPIENDEDVSFSDLEEDDGDVPTNYKNGSDSSTKDSRDWVQLGSDSSTAGPRQVSGRNSEVKETNDWLDVDDIDVA